MEKHFENLKKAGQGFGSMQYKKSSILFRISKSLSLKPTKVQIAKIEKERKKDGKKTKKKEGKKYSFYAGSDNILVEIYR